MLYQICKAEQSESLKGFPCSVVRSGGEPENGNAPTEAQSSAIFDEYDEWPSGCTLSKLGSETSEKSVGQGRYHQSQVVLRWPRAVLQAWQMLSCNSGTSWADFSGLAGTSLEMMSSGNHPKLFLIWELH